MNALRMKTFVVVTECVKTRSVLSAASALKDSTKLDIIAMVSDSDRLHKLVKIGYLLQ